MINSKKLILLSLIIIGTSSFISSCEKKNETVVVKSSPSVETTESNTSTETTTSNQTNTKLVFYTEDGIAIRGTDPVAYFTESKPVKGNPDFSYEWGNTTWHFSSEENKNLFSENPEKYAPQYGGFCAWAVSEGYTAEIDPNAWKIVDDKLYLNYSKGVQKKWEKDIPKHIEKANTNWVDISAEL